MAKKKETKKEMEVVNEFKEVETLVAVEQPKKETMVLENPEPKANKCYGPTERRLQLQPV